MEVVILLLATAFGGAGALKLLAPSRGPTLASRFAERGPIEAFAVASLPWLEFALAGALVVPKFRKAAAIVCLIVLAVFTAVLVSRRDENALPCGCFGSSSNDSGWWPYVRNSLLGALALVAAIGGESRGEAGVLGLIVLASIGIMTSVVLSRELRQQAISATTGWDRQSAEEPLKAVREQVFATTDGKSASIDRWLSTGRTHVILFVDPLCGPCRSLLPAVAALQRASGNVAVATISRGPMSENVELAREFGLAPVAVCSDDSWVRRLGIHATPSAILTTAKGDVVHPPAVGKAAILKLLGRAGQVTVQNIDKESPL